MVKRIQVGALCGLLLVFGLASAPGWADTLVLITSSGSQNANDSVKWSQLGGDATLLPASFSAQSGKGIQVTANLGGANSQTSVVCPASPCSWTSGTNFTTGDTLVWTSDAGNGGNGPLQLNFASKLAGAGATIQADGPGQFTAKIQAFNGTTSLGSFTVTSNTNGDAVYIGVVDQTGPNISSITLSLTTCVGTCTDFGVDTVLMNAAQQQFPLTVTLAGSGGGAVTSSPAGINCPTTCSANFNSGQVVTLTAKPNSNSTFSGWSGACTGTGTCTVTMNSAQSVTATFTLKTYTLTVKETGGGKGTVTSSPGGINCPTTCSAPFNAGTQVTLTATASQNSIFKGWSGACTGTSNTCTVTMTAAKSATAIFQPSTYKVTVMLGGTKAGTVTSSPAGINCGTTCSASFNNGSTVTLTATPNGGHTFTGWTGACTGTGLCKLVMTGNKSVTATFQ